VVVCLCSLSFMLGRMAGKPRCPSYHSRSFKFSSFTSSLDAGNSTALQSKLLNQDKRRFPANQNQTRERNSTSSKNKNGKLGASPLQNSSLRILLLTAMTANKIEEYQQATNSKQCYALKHGYTFIVETNSEMAKNINPWWFKVYAIQKYLPFFDWVIWLDGDCLVSNPDIKFEWFLDDPTADLVLTDHNFAVNNGVFALRRTEWSQEFLHKWLGAGQMVHAGGARWWQDDQGAMFHMLVAQGNQSYDGHCALREKCCSDVLEDCFREGMKAGGHPYLGRRVPKVRFISPKSHYVAETGASIRGGFDQYRRQDLAWGTGRWNNENFYHQGDFITHVGGKNKLAKIESMVLASMRQTCFAEQQIPSLLSSMANVPGSQFWTADIDKAKKSSMGLADFFDEKRKEKDQQRRVKQSK